MTGSSIFDYIHPQDHAEVAEQLGLGLASNQGLASPSSAISDENGTNQGTNNPDGKCFFQFYVLFVARGWIFLFSYDNSTEIGWKKQFMARKGPKNEKIH